MSDLPEMKRKKRVVIKVGTSILTHKTGRLNIRRVEKFVKILSDLQNSGKEIILVSSGAMGLGMARLGLSVRPSDTPMKQACAAVGQCQLMYIYDNLFGEYGITVAQILLTKDIIEKHNVVNTFETLIRHNVIPIVNENDTVAIDELELEFGENDTLAAEVTLISGADILVVLSDIDGFYDKNPKIYPDAKLIEKVFEITDELRDLAGDSVSALGSGGMATKLNAAEIIMDAGVDMIILNGKNPSALYDLFDGKKIGTVFLGKR